MSDLKDIIALGKEAALFTICIILLWRDWQDHKDEVALKNRDLDNKQEKK